MAYPLQETERKPQSRRLELNGYLTKPTTRLGRYNLLLREILKRTPDDHPDKEAIPQVMGIITQYLVQVNAETGRRENLFNLEQIQERLSFKSPAEYAVSCYNLTMTVYSYASIYRIYNYKILKGNFY